MKITFSEKRPPNKIKFGDLKLGDTFYYEWAPNDIRIKISNNQCFSLLKNDIVPQVSVDDKYIKVKTEATVYRG